MQDLRLGLPCAEDVNLEIRRGEIFALLGPNGAGKTTLINIICGIVNADARARCTVDGHDIVARLPRRRARRSAWCRRSSPPTCSRPCGPRSASAAGCSASAPNPAHIEKVLRDLSLWDKKDTKIMTLSGGMKRRVLIAKALSHEPQILFLDEPTAGVDVELRRDMWQMVRELRDAGVTIILTTHYIEEAEEMADRIGVISKGELILVEDKAALMRKLGKKQLTLHLQRRRSTRSRRARRAIRCELGDGRHRARLHLRHPARAHRHRGAARRLRASGHRLQGPAHERELARGHLRQPGEAVA